MGLHLPKLGRFTETEGLLLARIEPFQVIAMRDPSAGSVAAELAPLAAIASLSDPADVRFGIRVAGLGVATRLRLLLPLDLHPERFGAGRCARVQVAHLSIVVLRRGAEEFELFCGGDFADGFFRSIEAAMAALAA